MFKIARFTQKRMFCLRPKRAHFHDVVVLSTAVLKVISVISSDLFDVKVTFLGVIAGRNAPCTIVYILIQNISHIDSGKCVIKRK